MNDSKEIAEQSYSNSQPPQTISTDSQASVSSSSSSTSTICSQTSSTKIKLEETDINMNESVSMKPATSAAKKQKKQLRQIKPRPHDTKQQKSSFSKTRGLGLTRSLSLEKIKVTRQMKRLSMISEASNQFKVPYGVMPWGSLYFYEGKEFKFKRDLYDNNPIRISYEIIDDTANNLNEHEQHENLNKKQFTNYTDWHYVLGDGFTLRKTAEDKSVVFMQRLDEKNKYKVFLSNKMIDIDKNEIYEIYNGNEYLNDLDQMTELLDGYDMTNCCYLTIAIIGRFMNAMGPSYLNSLNDSLTREKCTSLPYWIILKLNAEYLMIDNQVQKLVFESTKRSMGIEDEKTDDDNKNDD